MCQRYPPLCNASTRRRSFNHSCMVCRSLRHFHVHKHAIVACSFHTTPIETWHGIFPCVPQALSTSSAYRSGLPPIPRPHCRNVSPCLNLTFFFLFVRRLQFFLCCINTSFRSNRYIGEPLKYTVACGAIFNGRSANSTFLRTLFPLQRLCLKSTLPCHNTISAYPITHPSIPKSECTTYSICHPRFYS